MSGDQPPQLKGEGPHAQQTGPLAVGRQPVDEGLLQHVGPADEEVDQGIAHQEAGQSQPEGEEQRSQDHDHPHGKVGPPLGLPRLDPEALGYQVARRYRAEAHGGDHPQQRAQALFRRLQKDGLPEGLYQRQEPSHREEAEQKAPQRGPGAQQTSAGAQVAGQAGPPPPLAPPPLLDEEQAHQAGRGQQNQPQYQMEAIVPHQR